MALVGTASAVGAVQLGEEPIAGAIASQNMDFGVLDFLGFGGVPVHTGTITDAEITGGANQPNFTVDPSGFISVNATGAGAVPSGPLNLNVTIGGVVYPIVVTIVTKANSWVVRTAAQFAQVCAETIATLSGKQIWGAEGEYQWDDSNLTARLFTSLVEIRSLDNAARMMFVGHRNHELAHPTNLRFYQVDFRWRSDNTDPLYNGAAAALIFTGNWDNFQVEDCDWDGGWSYHLGLTGNPFLAREYGWRGLIGVDGTSTILTTCKFHNNRFHDSYRCLNLPGGPGVLELTNNEIYNAASDCMVLAGARPNGIYIAHNWFRDPIPHLPPEVAVVNVDVANDRMTADSDRFGDVLETPTINMGESTVVMPGGVDLPGVGGANDYQTIIQSIVAGQSEIEFVESGGVPVDITSVGSGVTIRVEPPHPDIIQFVVGAGNSISFVIIICNVGFGKAGPAGWPQNFFLEDIASELVQGQYDVVTIAGNMIWGAAPQGIWLYNSYDSIIGENDLLGPASVPEADLPSVFFGSQWSWPGARNTSYNNVARQISSDHPDTIQHNDTVLLPANYESSGLYASGSGSYDPQTIQEFVDRYGSRSTLNGIINRNAKTHDFPIANKCTMPAFADETDISLAALVISGPVQITDILQHDDTASAEGVLITIVGEGNPEFQVTSDAGGAAVVRPYGPEPYVMQAGHYLWRKSVAASAVSTTRRSVIRAGRSHDVVEVTTKATVPATLSNPTDTKTGSTTANCTVDTDAISLGTIDWVITQSATAPNATDLLAGTGADQSGSQATSGSTTQNIAISGLTADTTYYFHCLQRNGADYSAIVSGDGFTTDAGFPIVLEENYDVDQTGNWSDTDSSPPLPVPILTTYDAVNDLMHVHTRNSFEGKTREISGLTVGDDYRFSVDIENNDPPGSNNTQVEMRLGDGPWADSDLYLPLNADRINQGERKVVVVTVTCPAGGSIWVHVNQRTDYNETFDVHRLLIENVTP